MQGVTQAVVDAAHVESKAIWATMRAEFTGPDVLFASSPDAMRVLCDYEAIRTAVEAHGFTLPPIDPKIQVTIRDEECA